MADLKSSLKTVQETVEKSRKHAEIAAEALERTIVLKLTDNMIRGLNVLYGVPGTNLPTQTPTRAQRSFQQIQWD